MSAYAVVVTSPATCTWPVMMSVSTATRLCGSSASSASRMEALIWSAILSGCPSVTDSDVKRRRVTKLSQEVSTSVCMSLLGRMLPSAHPHRPGRECRGWFSGGDAGGDGVPQGRREDRLGAVVDDLLAAVGAQN